MEPIVNILILPLLFSTVFAVVIDKESESYVNEIIKEFEAAPASPRFAGIIQPPAYHQHHAELRPVKFLPKVFIWCPISHENLQIKCPVHKENLIASFWTNVLARKSPRNPRLIFDVGENAVLVQRYYQCRHGHRYLSANPELMKEAFADPFFPLRFYHKTIYTLDLIDLVNEFVGHGVNFLQISDSLASLSYKRYIRRLHRYFLEHGTSVPDDANVAKYDSFEDNVMFSFPSNDKITNLFLDDFRRKKYFYDEAIKQRKIGEYISTDHTFKISKSVGIYRKIDAKFVKQYENLFIVLNEDKEVIAWKLTQSVGHDELRDLLNGVRRRSQSNDTHLRYVCLDKCCGAGGDGRFYKEIFGDDVDVKLDLFYAVQRVVKVVKHKKDQQFQKFSSEFGLIFRQDNDMGSRRLQSTPEPDKIVENLDLFLNRWRVELSKMEEHEMLMNEIGKLKKHILNGCLSGIQPGSGIEANERLHRLLNRSLVSGASNIGPELLEAILAIIFYCYNVKLIGRKHKCNKRTKICRPVDASITDLILAEKSNDSQIVFNSSEVMSVEGLSDPKITENDNRRLRKRWRTSFHAMHDRNMPPSNA